MRAVIAIYLIFAFGILWHSLPQTLGLVLLITPWVLLLTYLIVLYPDIKEKNFGRLIWLGTVFLITFIVEILGVTTGEIFGSYTYGDTLGVKLLGVPLIIGLNWGMIILGAAELSAGLKSPLIIKIFIASLAAVLLDFLIEPVAMKLDYWNWSGSVIPLQNYLAWFIISFLFTCLYYILRDKTPNRITGHFYLSQLLFFGALNLIKI